MSRLDVHTQLRRVRQEIATWRLRNETIVVAGGVLAWAATFFFSSCQELALGRFFFVGTLLLVAGRLPDDDVPRTACAHICGGLAIYLVAQTFVACEWWKQLQVSAHRAAWSQVLAHASVPLVTVWCMASTWSSNGAGFWVKMRAIVALQSILRLVDATVHPFSPRWEGNVHLVASLVELGVVYSLNLGCRQSIATLMSPRISVGLAYLSKASTVPAGVDSGGHADDAGASASPAHTLNNTYTRNTLTHAYTNTAPACALPVFCKHTLPL